MKLLMIKIKIGTIMIKKTLDAKIKLHVLFLKKIRSRVSRMQISDYLLFFFLGNEAMSSY